MPQCANEPGGGRKDLMVFGGPAVSPAQVAEERRRRYGSRQLTLIWADYATNALRGRIGQSGITLNIDVLAIIRLYIVRLREACWHYFLRCPVCGFRRCPMCGQKFLYVPPDPPPCTCVRRPRRSQRLAALTEQNGTNSPTPAVAPLHAAFPLLYGLE